MLEYVAFYGLCLFVLILALAWAHAGDQGAMIDLIFSIFVVLLTVRAIILMVELILGD